MTVLSGWGLSFGTDISRRNQAAFYNRKIGLPCPLFDLGTRISFINGLIHQRKASACAA
jgi:hypothetical protein